MYRVFGNKKKMGKAIIYHIYQSLINKKKHIIKETNT